MLRSTTGENNLYLSPHLDDAAFSLGALIARQPGGTVVNVFTRSAYVAGRNLSARAEPSEIARISAIRRAEDDLFVAQSQLRRVDLGAEEPSLRGRHPFDGTGVDEDITQIRTALTETLERAVRGGQTKIFCPAGLGRHVNHLAVRAVVVEWYEAQRSVVQLSFYEDLPYAANLRARWGGLIELRRALKPNVLRRMTWPAPPSKLKQINIYRSQHSEPVTELGRFSPAALWPRGAHEAIWTVLG